MNFRIPASLWLSLFLTLSTITSSSDNLFSKDLIKKNTIFYLGSSGFLIQLDLTNLQDIKEIGKKPIGKMPWQGIHCQDYLYSTDFASNQLFAYNLTDKSIKNKYLPTESTESPLVLYDAELEKENKKSYIQRFFNKIHKQDKKESKRLEAIREPLEISSHNKKLGVSSIACSQNYLFVSASLKERIDVLSKKSLERVSSIKVPSNYNLAVSPNQRLLAISSGYLDRVYLIEIASLKDTLEIDLEGNPTQMAWLNDNLLAILSRESGQIKIFDLRNNSLIQELTFQSKVNSIKSIPRENLLIAVSGEGKEGFLINTLDFKHQTFTIDSALRFADLIGILDSKRVLIGSSRDGRMVLIDLASKDFRALAKIQANLMPVDFISRESQSLLREKKKKIEKLNKPEKPKESEQKKVNLIRRKPR